jgi:protein phosphatase
LSENWLEKGILDAEEARRHPLRNQITRALGYEKQVQVDFYEVVVRMGDIWLFLHRRLTLIDMRTSFCPRSLTELTWKGRCKIWLPCHQRGGEDNITAIAVRV